MNSEMKAKDEKEEGKRRGRLVEVGTTPVFTWRGKENH